MFKFVIKILSFAAVIILLLQVYSYTLPTYWGNEVIYKKMQQMAVEKRPVNTAFIGTSRVHSHINPKLYDSLVKKSHSFNLGSPGASGVETTRIIDDLIETAEEHDIKTIYAEIPAFYVPPSRNSQSVRARYFYDLQGLLYSIRFKFNKPDISFFEKCEVLSPAIKTYLENFFNLGLFRDALSIGWHYHFGEKIKDRTPKRGFNELKRTISKKGPVNSRQQMAKKFYNADEKGTQNTENIFLTQVLLENISKAKAKGIDLVYILFPKVPTASFVDKYYSLMKLPPKNALNLSNPKIYPAFYKQENSADKAHLNYKGAKILTEYLAEHSNQLVSK